MQASIETFAFRGVEAAPVKVQVHLSNGLPNIAIVGLADKAVSESKERVRAALSSLGLALPPRRIAVNLAPADLSKEGSHYDLPIALGLLVAMNAIPQDSVDGMVVMGELSLDGTINGVHGMLAAAITAANRGMGIICPEDNGAEVAWAGEMPIIAAPNLVALINHLQGTQVLATPEAQVEKVTDHLPDMQDLVGQEMPRRALEITAVGGHNLLMVGPPGSGKSMLAARLPALLPSMLPRESLEVTMLHSIAGKLNKGGLIVNRPFRDPHHSASIAALVGGGKKARPGEVSLAHGGVLFLDELAEWPAHHLDSLRQTIESGKSVVSRVNHHVTYLARFQLIAAMNPCRCGYLGDPSRACAKAPRCGRDYMAKISGPLIDRFDMMIEVSALPPSAFTSEASSGESSQTVAKRVANARNFAFTRPQQKDGIINANLDGNALDDVLMLSEVNRKFLRDSAERLNLSARGYHRVMRVARSIADLDESAVVEGHHLSEAMQYRWLPLLA
ncbi:MAG: YifB family Mg chelatase-like AAA ATPase [Proteobacteria bacterium]|nr:YifB family Mg chelatase-like AAA ATPase [Pseudomonadota bacterium]